METNSNVNQSSNRPDRHGSNNPMFGRHHTDSAKLKQKNAALERNRQYKKWKDSQHHVSMDEFLSNNPTVEEYIKTLVRESIQKFIWKEKNHRIQIPNQWD